MAIDLWLESEEDSLSVRRFSVREALSSFFEASITAVSPRADLDLHAIVGRAASLRLTGGPDPLGGDADGQRLFRGVVRSLALARVEPGGLSTYEVRLVHPLWLLSQRTDHRIFQHLAVPEIVTQVLAAWGIAAEWRIEAAAHPPLDYRVQYGETDLAFVSRLLEEAGITYRALPTSEDRAAERGSRQGPSRSGTSGNSQSRGAEPRKDDRPALLFTDAPQRAEPREGGPIPFVDTVTQASPRERVTEVQLTEEVRPTRAVLRDFDFRHRTDFELSGSAQVGSGSPRLESYRYRPGALTSDSGAPRPDARLLAAAAARDLAQDRHLGRSITFATSALSLEPGTVFAIAEHPHPLVAPDKHLLVTSQSIEGGTSGSWTITCTAVPAADPLVPPRVTPKPRTFGVDSAIVVGPMGQPIHTDEHGRVRVQFRWDRTGTFDEGSSCWIRVSQGWAGAGYGLLALPRVGQEVLVAFHGGDPDQPVIVGRLFNGPHPVPFKLPEHATRSTWRSDSVPGSDGFNELLFEDAKGRELVYLQAERDLEELVKADASITVGQHRTKRVGLTETEVIGAGQTTLVGANRSAKIAGVDSTTVGLLHAVTVEPSAENARAVPPTSAEIADRKITLTTGEATITLEGPNITLDAAASILLNAASEIAIHGRANIKVMSGAEVRIESTAGDVVLQGAPLVHINPERRGVATRSPLALPVEVPPEVDIEDHLDEIEDHRLFHPDAPHWFQDKTARGGEWDPLKWGPAFEEFGFFHLGLLGRAAGLPAGVLLRMAGKRSLAEGGVKREELGDPGNGIGGGRAPFGNEPQRYEALKKGILHFDEHPL